MKKLCKSQWRKVKVGSKTVAVQSPQLVQEIS